MKFIRINPSTKVNKIFKCKRQIIFNLLNRCLSVYFEIVQRKKRSHVDVIKANFHPLFEQINEFEKIFIKHLYLSKQMRNLLKAKHTVSPRNIICNQPKQIFLYKYRTN